MISRAIDRKIDKNRTEGWYLPRSGALRLTLNLKFLCLLFGNSMVQSEANPPKYYLSQQFCFVLKLPDNFIRIQKKHPSQV